MTLRKSINSISPEGDADNYYNKSQTNALLNAKASTSLDNLSSTGQLVVDSQNGTISNCILEIPQNIKLELSTNVLTLKAGSVLTKTGSTYATVAVTEDKTHTVPKTLADGLYYIMSSNGGFWSPTLEIEYSVTATTGRHVRSGDTLPESGDASHDLFYLTTDKSIYFWGTTGWQNRTTSNNACYPLCIIEMKSGVASFAKDSNGNDMIFNGAGFIGNHGFIYPGIKMLNPMGLNNNGKLMSELTVTNSLSIVALGARNSICCYSSTTIATCNYLGEYKTIEEAPTNISSGIPVVYISGENKSYQFSNNQWTTNATQQRAIVLIKYTTSGTTVTDFAIRQPIKTATVEMLDKKQNDVTSITGYDATKTQTLKNVSGTLTWVDDII